MGTEGKGPRRWQFSLRGLIVAIAISAFVVLAGQGAWKRHKAWNLDRQRVVEFYDVSDLISVHPTTGASLAGFDRLIRKIKAGLASDEWDSPDGPEIRAVPDQMFLAAWHDQDGHQRISAMLKSLRTKQKAPSGP